MCNLDQETLTIIIETANNVKHIKEQLDKGDKEFEKINNRLNRIEHFFFPIVLVISGITHKVLTWFKL